jgi:integrase
LRNIGISNEEIKERNLHLHAWRHFFNTQLLKGGLSIPQTQAVIRHKSAQMTGLYSHFDPSDYLKAREVQDALLRPIEAEAEGQTGENDTVISFPVNEAAELRKEA